nr:hypothetical protein [Tanacetum cinerariifolium]
MSIKRRSKRNPRTPIVFNDFVMETQSLKNDELNRITVTNDPKDSHYVGVNVEKEIGEFRDEEGSEYVKELTQTHETHTDAVEPDSVCDSMCEKKKPDGKDNSMDLNEVQSPNPELETTKQRTVSTPFNVRDLEKSIDNLIENMADSHKANSQESCRGDNNNGNVWKKNNLVRNKGSSSVNRNVKSELDNSLSFVPTEIIGDDREVVVFDEDLVKLGSKNWLNTLCGYFVGCNMTVSELKYNVRRMWSRFGLRDVQHHSNGVFLFKFANNEGLQFVLENRPWLINGKALLVQKWQLDVCIKKTEPSKLPLWVKLLNVPLEAWTQKGISALASGVGKPIIMDALTTEICHSGKGKLGYARVLVEPDLCKNCGVFGHNEFSCKFGHETQNEKGTNEVNNDAEKKKTRDEQKGFIEVQYKKKVQTNGNQKQQKNFKNNNDKNKDKAKWSVKDDILQAMKRSANKYVVLEVVSEKENIEINILQELKVAVWNVRGMNQEKRQNEVSQLIKEEKLNVCVVIESHLKANKLVKACSKTFGSWVWVSNSMHSRKGCKIIVSWNDVVVRVMLVHATVQSILCLLEDPSGNVKIYCSFIYAKNKGVDRRDLWEDLKTHHVIVNGNPWVLMGDFNVTLSLGEHSIGGSNMNVDMKEFNDCVNSIKVEDLCSSGLFFTWTKNPKALFPGVMKKLDRVMTNESFIQEDLVKEKQRILDKDPHNGSLKSNMVNILNEYQDAMIDEEKLFYQNAKIEWLKEGDNNTAFFHKVVKGRMNKSIIESIFSHSGNRIEGESDSLFTKKLNEEEAIWMIREVTDNEIKDAMFNIGDNKAPGPDGFTSSFFKKAWGTVGNDVCKDIREFFSNGKLLGEVNSTVISLVPKIPTPNKVTDYRPIACLNLNTIKVVKSSKSLISALQMLVVMCHRDKKSVEVIKDSLEEFSNCSGLIPNPSKSTVFFENIGSSERAQILSIMPFSVGTLPTRYLGVPLITKRLGIKQCKCLIDKVERKVKDWKNRWLSFAGRLQLISSVLSSIQVYWSSIFLIPSAVVKEINRLLKGFLWVQGELTSGKAKISWSSVCKPKSAGGLGIKDLSLWNKAMLVKHLWNLACKKDTLWVKWIHAVKLKGVLSNYITHRSLYNARLNVRIKVANMIEDNCWKWPNEWMTKYPHIVNIPVPNIKTTTDDKVIWKNESGKIVKFSVKNVL